MDAGGGVQGEESRAVLAQIVLIFRAHIKKPLGSIETPQGLVAEEIFVILDGTHCRDLVPHLRA
jgi:hypothetical protein